MWIGNDTSGIANKITLNILNKEGYVVEEEEFKKKTTLDIAKYSLKEDVKEGDTNTYTLNIQNVGENTARIVRVEEKIESNANIIRDSLRIIDSNGQDVTNNKNIVLEKEITDDNKIIAVINKMFRYEKYEITYDALHNESETEQRVKTISKARGLNTEEKVKESIINVRRKNQKCRYRNNKSSWKKDIKSRR